LTKHHKSSSNLRLRHQPLRHLFAIRYGHRFSSELARKLIAFDGGVPLPRFELFFSISSLEMRLQQIQSAFGQQGSKQLFSAALPKQDGSLFLITHRNIRLTQDIRRYARQFMEIRNNLQAVFPLRKFYIQPMFVILSMHL